MLIRIFASEDIGITKYLNFLRLEQGSNTVWNVEYCDPVKWSPSLGDIHIYVDVPIRLAVPWAKYNIFASDLDIEMWAWTKTEMDLIISTEALTDRKTAIPTLRKAFRSAVRGSHPPTIPVPPAKGVQDIPPKVGIITLTRNRRAWWANMLQNVVKQSWPPSRMEWIIVDDGDEGSRIGEEVEAFMEKSPGIMIRYVEMTAPKSIGFKRNAAVEAASEDTTVFVCMDDDDHYPANSIGTRVAWLRRNLVAGKGQGQSQVQSQIGYCSVIPMYDLTRYISAMNVPELELGPAERVSEATLVFTKEAWLAKPFPDLNMAEGQDFIEGREAITVEMPWKDVIVSFIHTKNTSSRRIPKDQEPNGCHYGFSDEFFRYIHEIGMAP